MLINNFSKNNRGFTRVVNFGIVFENALKNINGLLSKFILGDGFKSQKTKTFSMPKSTTGFTLVEMLVSISVFMIVMTVAVGSLVSIIDANRKAQAIKNVVNNINFALESISKDMRVGTKYSCYIGTEYVGDCTDGGDKVKYLSSKLDTNGEPYTIRYRFIESPFSGKGNIQMCSSALAYAEDAGCTSEDNWESITAPSNNVNITNMKFYVLGSETVTSPVGARAQPRIIITIEGTAGQKENIKTKFNIQTTVSQRVREF